MTKLIISVLFVCLLSACGTSSDSNSTESQNASAKSSNNTTKSADYVPGDFKHSANTGMYAPIHDSVYGNLGFDCSLHNDYYFETENAVVFGSKSFSEDDFRYTATLVEQQLPVALSKFDMTQAEFNEARPHFITRISHDVIDYMSAGWEFVLDEQYYFNDITDLELTTEFKILAWDYLSSLEKYKFVSAYWNKLSKAEQIELAQHYVDAYAKVHQNSDFNPVNGYGNVYVPEKIMVCLTTQMDSQVYGEGTILGMNLPPKSHATRNYNDEEQVVLHELIHTIQQNVAGPVRTAGRLMDHWFLEGQATFLADQTTASSANGHNPVDVVTWSDESMFSDAGTAYKHYALAYSYIDSTSSNNMKKMLNDIRTYRGVGEFTPMNLISGAAFEFAFDSNMKNKGGDNLTLQEFRSNYHSLMN